LRTSLERIAPESLTLSASGFVHGDIWHEQDHQPPYGVFGISVQPQNAGN
jgi:hypothetical protein